MFYKQREQLPENVKKSLPEHGQVIYMNAFNNA
jgi:cation transport regulator ChaB